MAGTVRLAGIGDRLGQDEGYSWLVASAPNADAFLDRLATYENTPPLFYLLLSPLPLDDEVWLRLPSFIAGVGAVAVLYIAVRPLLGTRVALLASLGLAVAPYHVSASNFGRAFMVADLCLLVVLWAVIRLALGGHRRWWGLYAAGGAAALYAEYYSAFFLAGVLVVLLLLRTRPWREVVFLGALPGLALLPWVPELVRSLEALESLKGSPDYREPSIGSFHDLLVPLFFGERGSADGAARTLQFFLLVGALAWAGVQLWRRGFGAPDAAGEGTGKGYTTRIAFLLFVGVPTLCLCLAAGAATIGPDIFHQRYLTMLIPLFAALFADAVSHLAWRFAVPATVVTLLTLALAIVGVRGGRELEPDGERVATIIESEQPTRVLTNSASMAYYLREFEPVLDRPLGLQVTPGRPCEAECIAVDDSRFGIPRAGPGRRVRVDTVVILIKS